MSDTQPTVQCPNCGCEFELGEAFAEHFAEEKHQAVQEAIQKERKRSEEEVARLEEEAFEAAEEKFKLDIEAKDNELGRIRKKLEELEKRTRQGSMELQGEALETHLENVLQDAFPLDTIESVAKGQSGADLIHLVINPLGQRCGTIIWEAKNTKHWNDDWLVKIKEDKSRANAQLMVIVSVALPDHLDVFDLIDGVWVCSVQGALALARVLRQGLLQSAHLQRAMEGKGDKMETVYLYLTSTGFRDRVQRMIETWDALKSQIDSEERAMKKQWKERRKQLDTMIDVTTDMYTDISSIIGAEMPRVEGLELQALPSGEEEYE
jgi:hypothetical protein